MLETYLANNQVILFCKLFFPPNGNTVIFSAVCILPAIIGLAKRQTVNQLVSLK